MLIMPISYEDFAGEQQTDTFHFNLTQAEVSTYIDNEEGIFEKILRLGLAKKVGDVAETVQELILISYGERSDDAKRFDKSPELAAKFKNHAAFNKLFMDIITDEKKLSDFVYAILPKGLIEKMQELEKMEGSVEAAAQKMRDQRRDQQIELAKAQNAGVQQGKSPQDHKKKSNKA